MKYRLYFAPNCGSYKLVAEHQNLDFIHNLAKKLDNGKYMIVLKSPKGDDVIELKFVGRSNSSINDDDYDLADRPKIKRRVKYVKDKR